MLRAVLMEGRVNLSRADYYAINLVVGKDGVVVVSGVWDDPLEVRVTGEVFNGGACERVAEEGFRKEKY